MTLYAPQPPNKGKPSIKANTGLNSFYEQCTSHDIDGSGPGVTESCQSKLVDPELLLCCPNGLRKVEERDLSLATRKAAFLIHKASIANCTTHYEHDALIEVIEENQQRFIGCLMLPVTLLFFTFYAVAAYLHEDITTVHLLESPVRTRLEPWLHDVNTSEDFWSFIYEIFLPLIFQQTDDYDGALLRSDWGRISRYNQLQGVVIFKQLRSISETCEYADHLQCYPMAKLSSEHFGASWQELSPDVYQKYRGGADPIVKCDDEGFMSGPPCAGVSGRRLRILRDDLRRWVPSDITSDDITFMFLLSRNRSSTTLVERINYLRTRQ